MRSDPHTRIATPLATMVIPQTASKARVRVKPEGATTGFVDGAWWPHSRELVTELPALLAALATRLPQVERVTYNFTAWDCTARRITGVGGGNVRLGGFRSQRAETVTVIGARGARRLTLLIVPPATTPTAARHALATAAGAGNSDSIATLLAPRVPEKPGTDSVAQLLPHLYSVWIGSAGAAELSTQFRRSRQEP